jgi:hypothetical protein
MKPSILIQTCPSSLQRSIEYDAFSGEDSLSLQRTAQAVFRIDVNTTYLFTVNGNARSTDKSGIRPIKD